MVGSCENTTPGEGSCILQQDQNPLLHLLCPVFWGRSVPLPVPSVLHTVCDSDRSEAVGTCDPAQEDRTVQDREIHCQGIFLQWGDAVRVDL